MTHRICVSFPQSDYRLLSRLSSLYKFKKPNDRRALDLMNESARAVMQALPDLMAGYGVSDEFRLVIRLDIFILFSCLFWPDSEICNLASSSINPAISSNGEQGKIPSFDLPSLFNTFLTIHTLLFLQQTPHYSRLHLHSPLHPPLAYLLPVHTPLGVKSPHLRWPDGTVPVDTKFEGLLELETGGLYDLLTLNLLKLSSADGPAKAISTICTIRRSGLWLRKGA
jgi:hypothetical protein